MRLISTNICKTSDIGVNNNLFGGRMLSWLDEAAGTMSAEEACHQNMVTLKMDEVLFKKAVKVSDHIRIYGKVISVGRSSLQLYLEARRFDFASRSEELVCSTKMTFVKVDEQGRSMPIHPNVSEQLATKIKNQYKTML
jgi:acyl-CoA thioesterase YciA